MRTFALAAVFAVAITTPAHGDFRQAVAAYQSQQFAVAYAEFRRLAELGDMPSQRNLAAMYARGEHVGKDLAEAWAWAALANEAGDADSQKLFSVLDQKLVDAEQRAKAAARSADLRGQFGRDALATRVFPVIRNQSADCTVNVTGSARPIKTVSPQYPINAARDGVNASACISFYLDASGKPVRIRAKKVEAFYPDGQRPYGDGATFVRSALAAIKQWRFVPGATDALREVPANYCLDFKVDDSTRSEANARNAAAAEAVIDSYEKNKAAALAGDPEAQFKLSRQLNTFVPGLPVEQQNDTRSLAYKFLLQSAINGHADGQFQLAADLLTGNQCEKDSGKGLRWLQFAAQQGQRSAQYLLASRLLRGDGVERDETKALAWLKAAAESGHERAKIDYAYQLMRQQPDRLPEAIALLPELPNDNDLPELEAFALSKALQGDFVAATHYQQLVVDIASEVGFASTTRQAVLQAFRNQQVPTWSATQL